MTAGVAMEVAARGAVTGATPTFRDGEAAAAAERVEGYANAPRKSFVPGVNDGRGGSQKVCRARTTSPKTESEVALPYYAPVTRNRAFCQG